MSLTAFNRFRRMQQVEEMKPENIEKEEKPVEVKIEEPKVEEPVKEKVEERKPITQNKTATRRSKK